MLNFYDPKSRRSYNIRLGIGLFLIAVVLVLGTLILALITAGYNVNRKNGQIIQNGLVFINSQPVSANLYVNGISRGTTNARLELPEGQYNFTLNQTGYSQWTNSLNLLGGSVTQLDYPFLFPTKPKQTTIETFVNQPGVVSESPNRHWLLTSIPNQFASFNVIDVTNVKAPQTSFAVPGALFANQTGSLAIVEWSTDNQHFLLKHTYNNSVEFVIVDRLNPTNSYNVEQTFKSAQFNDIKLVNKSYSKLYLYNSANQQLMLADLSSQVVSPILNGVLAFWPYGNSQILFATPDKLNSNNSEVRFYDGGKTYNLRDLHASDHYLLNVASYNGHMYVVLGSGSEHNVYVYQDPLSVLSSSNTSLPVPFTFLQVSGSPTLADFSTSARFIAVQNGTELSIYDFLGQTHYRYDTKFVLPYPESVTWMDGDRLTFSVNNKLTIFDFDNTNRVTYSNQDPAYLPAFNSSYTGVYTVSQSSPNQWQLIRTSLVAGQP